MDFALGQRANSVTGWVSSLAGINRESSSSLISLALPAVLAQICKLMSSSGGGASSLTGLLTSQKKFLGDAPAGLAGTLGLSEATFVGTYDSEQRIASSAAPVVGAYESERRSTGSSWWKWALPLAALVALLGFFFTRRDAPKVSTTAMEAAREVVAPAIASLGAFVEKRLPSGTSLNVPANGVESKLIAFIEDPNQKVDKETWFSFDRLEFETDSAQLKTTSHEQLRNVAEILKANSRVNVKIGGYTDNVGDAAYNLKLSGERATNTMNEIVRLGVDPSRPAAEGYGEKFPVADNTTEEGRQRNRRIDIRVTKM